LVKVAQVAPDLRVRFTTSHPKDMTDEVLHAMAAHANICKYIHLPVQSGNTDVLERMNRGYTREWYLKRIATIRRILPGCAVSTDIITGFCGETEAEHADTLSLMREVRYDYAYMFHYSERPGTLAARRYPDDIPLEVKKARLQEVIDLQLQHNLERQQEMVGTVQTVLLEGNSKRSEAHYAGRADNNQMVVFAKGDTQFAPGTYVQVRIFEATGATLIGEIN
jgi:tRNA-2-methylthio-N6-dimethylallyladenosine synthase